MTVLAFAPEQDTPGKRDASAVFLPEARAWVAAHGGGRLYTFDNELVQSSRHIETVTQLSIDENTYKAVGFFCHGWRSGLQCGFGLRDVDTLAELIKKRTSKEAIVTLYACSTAAGHRGATGGDGGFADQLRDALCRAGATWCRVDAHDRPGHATWNPYVRRFEGLDSPVGGIGGQWIVAPGSPLWKMWVRELRESNLRLRFPFMTIGQVHEELLRKK